MNELLFSKDGWDEYVSWQNEDRKTLKKINDLLISIQRDGLLNGIGKPEKLREVGAYSRRIDNKNRLVYCVDEKEDIRILSCKDHYDDK